ncbi:FtsK/SpoIIIE domain-containing protein [Microtetraspora sp. NBRC 16547]|uniref:FtsK/SpoIIIE domain-containing protein n=1 Tax=Microtetraspora sp. NBRC 16547 TaxID=3030993 RepID=UPI00249F9FF4|nr:FtsK/SpoIIIE domain-containing protein [Microtetraspora sp. NBRC 16547]GLW96136.1 cell division protein FtsK [Microtetraspora sp. NBRC 16547]
MRIMLTVVAGHGRREVMVEGDESTTVGALATALAGPARPSNVVRLPPARAPYDLDRGRRRRAEGPKLWVDGRPLDPDALVFGLIRDGDLVALDGQAASATMAEEPDGVIELRVAGGPGAGSVHRLGPGLHTMGSDPGCAIAVPDPRMPPHAATIRVAPGGVTVEPAHPAAGLELDGEHVREATPWEPRDPDRRAAEASGKAGRGAGRRSRRSREARKSSKAGKSREDRETREARKSRSTREARARTTLGARQAAEPGSDRMAGRAAAADPRQVLLSCGGSVFSIGPVEPPDAHLDALPDGGLAYNRPPRLRAPERHRRVEVPAEPKRAEGARLQLLAALLPAVLGVGMAIALHTLYFLLFALMSPMIMLGQWASDRRHGRKKHRQAVRAYRDRLVEFEAEVAGAREEDEAARRDAAPDPAEILLTATGPRRRLWERRLHDPDSLRLRVGLADLPADVGFAPERGTPADEQLPEPPLARHVPVALAMRRLGVAGVTGPRDVALGAARWLVGQAAALHSPRDLAVVVLSAHADAAEQWGWVRWLPHCAAEGAAGGAPSVASLASGTVALVGADPEAAARRIADLAALIGERLDPAEPAPPGTGSYGTGSYGTGSYGTGSYGTGSYGMAARGGPLSGGPAGWADLGRPGSTRPDEAAEPAFATYDERPCDVLVVLDGAQVLRGLPGMPQVLRQGPRAGVYTVAIDDDERLLPEECATVVSCEPDGSVRLRGGGLDAIGPIRADQVSASWSERLGRALAPLRDVSRDDQTSALPESVRLLDLVGSEGIAKRWGRSTRAVIGVGPDGPFEIDISRDGPHALIAGTTGAGKSELLQTLICSLAAANRPDEMTFVLIDYKGGAAFKECVRLPHTVGMVTDLDGHLTQRALASLAAEIRRRERLLLSAGAKDIEDYQGSRASGSAPLPRLVLVIDEFAAMVAELPDFMDGLVDIARRGRSLGIHLVLATQRPGGVVTADIQANTSLRIALRVTDARESADVIDGPEAAHISKATPGRCYVRSGSGQAVAVQAARIGGRTPDGRDGGGAGGNPRVIELPWRALGHALPSSSGSSTSSASSTSASPGWSASPGSPASSAGETSSPGTDLALLVDAIDAAARGIARRPSPWLPPLPDAVTLSPERGVDGRPPAPGGALSLPFGLTDLPWDQARGPLSLDLENGGHLLIAGTARSGRSTALRTIAGSIAAWASPEDVHLYAVDCGSGALLPLVGLPHCGAVVTRDQLDRVERLLSRLRAEVGRRQQLLAEAGYASLAEARAAAGNGPGGDGPAGDRRVGDRRAGDEPAGHTAIGRLPWLVLLLDRWEGYVAAFENYDYGRLLDALLQLLREGPAVGLRAVVTSDRSGLLGQISTVFEERLVLRLADPADYGLAGLPVKDLPSFLPPGRALSVGEHGLVESQIALLADDPSGPAQVAALQALGRTAPARFGGDPERRGPWGWRSAPPLRVDALPIRVTADQAMDLAPSFEPPSPLWALLGVGGDALEPLGLDLLSQGPAAVIGGPARSGRSSCLVTAARSLVRRGTPVLVVTPRRSPLREMAGAPGVLAVLDGNARGVAGGEPDGFGGLPGAQDPRALLSDREGYVVIVDDAELISPDSPLGLALEEILRTARDGEHGLLIAGATGDLATAYRGFTAEARKSRTGLLLSVQSPADGDLFSVRLPRGAVGGPPGRGLLITSGTVTPIQAAVSG